MNGQPPVWASGAITLGGDLTVHRLGLGAMRLTGDGVWGEPGDPGAARATLRRALELGIDLVDTADSYGPDVSERLVAEALRPYPPNLVIATKGGLLRDGPAQWRPDGRPAHLRGALEGSLRRLGLERIDLYQLHRPDPAVPFEESVGELVRMREQGLVRHIGLSNVDEEQLRRALAMCPIASVQNRYNLQDRRSDPVLRLCERHGIAFLPWNPLAIGRLTRRRGPLEAAAAARHVTPAQLALGWLLARSPVIVPIPGTSSVAHLEENAGAAGIALGPEEVEALTAPQAE